jgi:hypothetical protein
MARVLLAQVALSQGHPEQVNDGVLQNSINDLRAEKRGGDEMEALTVEIQTFLASGNIDSARRSLALAKALHNTTWLSNYHLMLAAAQIDAAEGKHEISHQEIAAAREKAEKVGCGVCELELRSPLYRADARPRGRTSKMQTTGPTRLERQDSQRSEHRSFYSSISSQPTGSPFR